MRLTYKAGGTTKRANRERCRRRIGVHVQNGTSRQGHGANNNTYTWGKS